MACQDFILKNDFISSPSGSRKLRGQANEFLLLTKAGDQVREWDFGAIGSRRLFLLAALTGLGRVEDDPAVGLCHGNVFEGSRL